MGDTTLYIMFLFFILLISCWVVAASLVAEQTNAGDTNLIFVSATLNATKIAMMKCFHWKTAQNCYIFDL